MQILIRVSRDKRCERPENCICVAEEDGRRTKNTNFTPDGNRRVMPWRRRRGAS